MDELLEELLEECRPYTKMGHVATYIPELAKRNPDKIGIYILNSNGQHSQAGDYKKKFTIQSIIKPILLLQALLFQRFCQRRISIHRKKHLLRAAISDGSPGLFHANHLFLGTKLLQQRDSSYFDAAKFAEYRPAQLCIIAHRYRLVKKIFQEKYLLGRQI